MRSHLLTPEQTMLRNYYAEINKTAWALRKVTGGALRLALLMQVPEAMRDDVLSRVQFLHQKHGIQEEIE